MLRSMRRLAVALLLVCLVAGSSAGLLGGVFSPVVEVEAPVLLSGPHYPFPPPPGGDGN